MADYREDLSAPLAGGIEGDVALADRSRAPLGPRAYETEPEAGPGATRSLVEDLEALIDAGRTYLDAELSYQKTRASFVSDRLKKAVAYGVMAAVIGLLAAIGLTVGLIIALTPLVTGWGATAIVVGVLLAGAFLLIRRAGRSYGEIRRAMRESDTAGQQTQGEG